MLKRGSLPNFLVKFSLFLLLPFSLSYASTLYLSITSNPSRLNPILSTDASTSKIVDKLFNGLLKYDKNANIVGDLAKRYYFIDDKTLIIELREDVYWHDGVKFSAKDVLFTFETILSPNIFTPYAASYEKVERVEIVDDYKIKISYKEPYFRALEIWMVGILPYHILKGEKNLMTSKFNSNPIGTGPYKLGSFKHFQDIELIANDNYFEGKPKIEKILYRFTPDPANEFMLLKKGNLDIGVLTPLQLERQVDNEFKERFKIIKMPGHSYGYMGFNLKNKKFADKRVRKALAMMIDRQKIIDIMTFGYAKKVNGPFLEGGLGYNKNVLYPPYDPDGGKELLKEAGYGEKNPLKFEISVPSSGSGKQIAQIIQYFLLQYGVEVSIKAIEWQAFLNTVIEPREFEAIIMAWSTPLLPNPETIWYSKSDKKGGFNFIGYSNKEVDKLIEEVLVTNDMESLDKKLQKIYALISGDFPYIFLYASDSLVAIKKEIKNIEPSIIGIEHNIIKWEKF